MLRKVTHIHFTHSLHHFVYIVWEQSLLRHPLFPLDPVNVLKGTFLSILLEVLERSDSEVLGTALLILQERADT